MPRTIQIPKPGVPILKEYLSRFSRSEFRKKIRAFRDLNIRRMSYSETQKAVWNTLSFAHPTKGGEPLWATPYGVHTYPTGTKFYRVRKFEHRVNPISEVDHCWCPPRNDTRIGRVNLPSHPVLYTSPEDPITAAAETGMLNGLPFCLLEYTARAEVRLARIGSETAISVEGFDEGETEKLEVLNDFLVDEFTRDVGEGMEHLYNVSNIIANEYFNYPNTYGHLYPSVVRKEGHRNAAFYESCSKVQLELTGIGQFRFWEDGEPGIIVKCEGKFEVAADGNSVVPIT